MQNYQTSYPIPKNMIMEPQRTIKSQFCGMTMAAMACLSGASFMLTGVAGMFASRNTAVMFENLFLVGFGAFYSYFFARMIFDKQYCSGKPAFIKIWPMVAAMVMAILGLSVLAIFGEPIPIIITTNIKGTYTESTQYFDPIYICLAVAFIIAPLACLTSWAMYFGDDEGESCCLCFKPWRLIADPILMFNPAQYPQAYPTHQGQPIKCSPA